jgi:nicotinamide-nucleotide amidase
VPGSSAVLREGVVTYSNEAKMERLGVSEALLAEHGAVSEPVAVAMAEGQLDRSGADVALSITGIAGPDGGTEEKPVGTVVFGLADLEGTAVRSVQWRGGRDEIRTRSVTFALEMLRRRLLRS